MSYDVAFRFQQALDPSALTTIPGALHGIGAAIDDCRRAGKAVDNDPAVLLLVRHLGNLASKIGDGDTVLRHACMDAIGDMRRKPVLNTLSPSTPTRKSCFIARLAVRCAASPMRLATRRTSSTCGRTAPARRSAAR